MKRPPRDPDYSDVRELIRELLFSARFLFGACPYHGQGSLGVVYRSSRRSVTMRCRLCGLQWTMTFVKMAQAARSIAEEMDANGSQYAARAYWLAEQLQAWAEYAVEETRGRHAS
jgi:hypothetical protein